MVQKVVLEVVTGGTRDGRANANVQLGLRKVLRARRKVFLDLLLKRILVVWEVLVCFIEKKFHLLLGHDDIRTQ
jgi:hypothetical protein